MEFKHIDSVALPLPTSEVSDYGLFHDDHTEYLVSCLKWFAHCAGVAGDMADEGVHGRVPLDYPYSHM